MEGNVSKNLLEPIAIYKKDNHVLRLSVMPILNVPIFLSHLVTKWASQETQQVGMQ
jgi:hypothetical protein